MGVAGGLQKAPLPFLTLSAMCMHCDGILQCNMRMQSTVCVELLFPDCGKLTAMPFWSSRSGLAKKGRSVRWLDTYAHSTMPVSPCRAFRQDSANLAAAYAMDRVADPFPACNSSKTYSNQLDINHCKQSLLEVCLDKHLCGGPQQR